MTSQRRQTSTSKIPTYSNEIHLLKSTEQPKRSYRPSSDESSLSQDTAVDFKCSPQLSYQSTQSSVLNSLTFPPIELSKRPGDSLEELKEQVEYQENKRQLIALPLNSNTQALDITQNSNVFDSIVARINPHDAITKNSFFQAQQDIFSFKHEAFSEIIISEDKLEQTSTQNGAPQIEVNNVFDHNKAGELEQELELSEDDLDDDNFDLDDLLCDEDAGISLHEDSRMHQQFEEQETISDLDIQCIESPEELLREQIASMSNQERHYAPDPYYMRNQKQILPRMRTLLIDWILQVSEDYRLKRETYQMAVNYLDRYLVANNVQVEKFQLIGTTALFLASKNEEIYSPRCEDFAVATANGFNSDDIFQCEKDIVRSLNWRLSPPSLNQWAQLMMTEWDDFVDSNPNTTNILLSCRAVNEIDEHQIKFKQIQNNSSRQLQREASQILDISLFHIQTLQFSQQKLTAAVLYIALGKRFNILNDQSIEMFQDINYTIGFQDDFSLTFEIFLSQRFNLGLEQVEGDMRYISRFFKLEIEEKITNAQVSSRYHKEEFQSFAVHNAQAMNFVQHLQSQRL